MYQSILDFTAETMIKLRIGEQHRSSRYLQLVVEIRQHKSNKADFPVLTHEAWTQKLVLVDFSECSTEFLLESWPSRKIVMKKIWFLQVRIVPCKCVPSQKSSEHSDHLSIRIVSARLKLENELELIDEAPEIFLVPSKLSGTDWL
ncbi:hypothetical protein BASA83_009102 [Batrachochytrium salamandrivorans]|nr:hypothetical protein BASA83_009102 [Batrachochytrium salamandrivorans]